MSLKINDYGISSLQHQRSIDGTLAVSREKMISLLVRARLLQSEQLDHDQFLPAFKKTSKEQITSAITFLSEVFGRASPLPTLLRSEIASYFTDEELGQLSIFVNLPRFVDLSNPNIFKSYAKTSVSSALFGAMIAQEIYECQRTSISETKYGQAFCMNPEIIAYMMQLAEKEIVLEIGGAHGKNSAVLAFSGAEKVYVNDICKEEMEVFETTKESLPPEVSKKLQSIPGDCFDLLKLNPKLLGQVGVLLCRSVIHFLNKEQQIKFFALLKTLLKPGGRAIFTVNSIYPHDEIRKLCAKNPSATSFSGSMGLINDYSRGQTPISVFYNELSICTDDHVSTNFATHYLYTKEPGSKWKENNEAFNQLAPVLQPKIKDALSKVKDIMKPIAAGSVRVVLNKLRIYSVKTLSRLFKQNGFQVEYIYLIAVSGHLAHTRNPFKKGRNFKDHTHQVGVIVRYAGSD